MNLRILRDEEVIHQLLLKWFITITVFIALALQTLKQKFRLFVSPLFFRSYILERLLNTLTQPLFQNLRVTIRDFLVIGNRGG